MRVIGVTEYGGPDALRVFDVPEPHAGPGQVIPPAQMAYPSIDQVTDVRYAAKPMPS